MTHNRAEEKHIGKLEFSCSDLRLTEGFQWAKGQALSRVFDGDPVGKWYEAALPGREAFCMRDTSHQAAGAHVLGLAEYTYNMLYKFAVNISPSRDWCSFWEIDRYDRPAPVDYTDDSDFWYNLPANFDTLDCCYRQYCWTGDRRYLEEPAFLSFYDRTVDDYVRTWDRDGDGIPDRLSTSGRRGIASYYESDLSLKVGADLVAAQYAAFRSYAKIQRLLGQHSKAEEYERKAERVQRIFLNQWWDAGLNRPYCALLHDGTFWTDYIAEMAVFPLYFGIVEPVDKRNSLIQWVLQRGVGNVEMLSYLPEVLFRYGFDAAATSALYELTHPQLHRREYPEVSFAAVGAIVTGLMGISAGETNAVYTLSHLPTHIHWAEVDSVPIKQNLISVRHEGRTMTTLSNRSGPSLTWNALFPCPGECVVDGKIVETAKFHWNGEIVYGTVIPVSSGETVTVRLVP